MTAISNVGAQVNLSVRQGADFITQLTFTNPDGSAVDLTGCELVAQIRRNINDVTPAAAFTFAIAAPTTGIAVMSMAAAITATLVCGPAGLSDPLSQYVWDLELVNSSGAISSPLYGNVQVFREVTR